MGGQIKNSYLYKGINNSYIKVIFCIILFVAFSFLNRIYQIGSGPEFTVRFTVGLSVLFFLQISYRYWVLLILAQIFVTYAVSDYSLSSIRLSIAISETIASFLTAVFFVLFNRDIFNRSLHPNQIIKAFLPAVGGALTGGLSANYLFNAFSSSVLTSTVWLVWSLSALIGIVLIVPIVSGFRDIDIFRFYLFLKKSFLELLLLLLSTVIIVYLLFNIKSDDINLSISFPYLILPFVFWATFRFPLRILSLLLLVISMLIFYLVSLSISGVEIHALQQYVSSVQVFVLFTSVFSYIVAGTIHVRKEAERKVKILNAELEERVEERTRVLQHTMEALQQSEEQFREAFETSLNGMSIISLKGNFLRVNNALCDMVGYPMERLLKTNLRKITFHEDYINEVGMLRKLIKGDLSFYQMEKRLIQKDNMVVWVMESISLIRNSSGGPSHIVSQIVDITERKQTEEQLLKYTETLTVLLREVNHRVKNNLSALIGILHMEEDRLQASGNEDLIALLRDLNSRIRSLATVHSMLSAANWQPLEISELFDQIIQAVLRSLPVNKSANLVLNKTNIRIGSNQAHHLTLVINELATNSAKYGLVEGKDNLIEVIISEQDGRIHIIYKDNGPGYPSEIIEGNYSKSGIGFELIRGVVTQSLDGELVLKNENGAVTEIIFTNELF